MKIWIPYLWMFTAFSCLYGEATDQNSTVIENSIDDQLTLQTIFRQDFLDAADKELLDPAACYVLASNEKKLSLEELKAHFYTLVATPQIEERFISIYSSYFSSVELPDVLELVQDSRYQQFRVQLAKANFACLAATIDMLEKAVLDLTPPVPEPVSEAELIPQPKPIIEQDDINKIKLPIVNVHKGNLEKILSSHRYVIVDSYTEWCGPCKNLAIVIKELQAEYGDQYQFAKLDAEKEKSLARTWNVRSYPTVIFFKDGKEVGRRSGFMNKQKFLTEIERFFKD